MTIMARLEDAVRAAGLPPGIRWSVEERPRRRNLAITINEYGDLTVLAPPRTPPAAVTRLLAVRRDWIIRHTTTDRPARAPVLSFTTGETLTLLGHTMRLLPTDTGPVRATLVDGVPALHAPRHNARAVIAWYCEEGLGWAAAHLRTWLPRLPLTELPALEVRDIGTTRWGLYHRDRHLICLHWTLFQLDPALAEGVLVHELVHATRPPGTPHGPAWRARMDAAMPDWRQRRRRLKEAQASLWRGETKPLNAPAQRRSTG